MEEQSKLQELAYKITEVLYKYNCQTDVAIYFEGKRLSTFADLEDSYGKWVLEEGFKGSSYTDYSNDNTITMTFEGDFYDVMNWGLLHECYVEFNELIKEYGYWFELGNMWNLALYQEQNNDFKMKGGN